jgi:hypothetical protein
VAAAGVLKEHTDCLEYPGKYSTVQAGGRQMARFGNRGSIILIASMSGSIMNKVCKTRCIEGVSMGNLVKIPVHC